MSEPFYPMDKYDPPKTTPLKAIRAKCYDCTGGSGQYSLIRDCKVTSCAVWPYRLNHRPGEHPGKSSFKSVRAFCKECMGGNLIAVSECPAWEECPLHRYRQGKNPHHSRSIIGGNGGCTPNPVENDEKSEVE